VDGWTYRTKSIDETRSSVVAQSDGKIARESEEVSRAVAISERAS